MQIDQKLDRRIDFGHVNRPANSPSILLAMSVDFLATALDLLDSFPQHAGDIFSGSSRFLVGNFRPRKAQIGLISLRKFSFPADQKSCHDYTMAIFKLLHDFYRFPGFVPLAQVRGLFGPPAVVITLRAAEKNGLRGLRPSLLSYYDKRTRRVRDLSCGDKRVYLAFPFAASSAPGVAA